MTTITAVESAEDFKTRLTDFAKHAIGRADRAQTEEATRQYLVLPFLQMLGYDPLNPDEVVPEAHASFSEKFKNRVDYAILKGGESVIAIECKKTGELKLANRGEIKGYFNAVPTTKLGLLTDGLIYEMYTDTGATNMMDDEPFARLDLTSIANGHIDPTATDAMFRLTKAQFDPANVGADARRKLFLAQHIESLDRVLTQPADALVRLLVDMAKTFEGNKTTRVIQEHKPLVAEAIQMYMDRKILERVGFASREDLVRTPVVNVDTIEPVAGPENGHGRDAAARDVITTEVELGVFNYAVKRLAFLVKEEEQFAKIENVKWVDYKTVFCVYYKQERKGRLFNFWEAREGKHRYDFGDGEQVLETSNINDIDEALLRVFTKRVTELS